MFYLHVALETKSLFLDTKDLSLCFFGILWLFDWSWSCPSLIGPSLPPRSSNSTPISQPGSMAPSMPFTSSPDNPPTQNPLSLIMSQMSKYAMPSSTPLYHDAIKTIATSDDEMMPDRPLLSGVNIGGTLTTCLGQSPHVTHIWLNLPFLYNNLSVFPWLWESNFFYFILIVS